MELLNLLKRLNVLNLVHPVKYKMIKETAFYVVTENEILMKNAMTEITTTVMGVQKTAKKRLGITVKKDSRVSVIFKPITCTLEYVPYVMQIA